MKSGRPTNRELLEHIHQLLHHEESGLLAEQRRIKKELRKLMSILADIKTINAETKEKVIALDTKLDSALAKNAGFKEAIRVLKARIAELIAAGNTDGIDAAGAQELLVAAQEIEDSTDAATVKADILANTDPEDDA